MTDTVHARAPRMLPSLDDRNRAFWTGGRNGELLILRDRANGRWVHPPERVSPERTGLAAEPVSGKGSIFTYTINHHSYHPDVPVPYVIALVELDEEEGLRLPANIVNCPVDEVRIGLRVRVAFQQHDHIFVPVFEPDR